MKHSHGRRLPLCAIIFIAGLTALEAAIGQVIEPVTLGPISHPGGSVSQTKTSFILTENLFTPQKVIFQGFAPGSALPVLSREELDVHQRGTGVFDFLETKFTIRVYTEQVEFFRFENIAGEELIAREVVIAPQGPGIPTGKVFIDLTVTAALHPSETGFSSDAGIYGATLVVTLVSIL